MEIEGNTFEESCHLDEMIDDKYVEENKNDDKRDSWNEVNENRDIDLKIYDEKNVLTEVESNCGTDTETENFSTLISECDAENEGDIGIAEIQLKQRLTIKRELDHILHKKAYLVTKEGNDELMKSVNKDKQIIKKIFTDDAKTLVDSCNLGKQLSLLVNDKTKKSSMEAFPFIMEKIIKLYQKKCQLSSTTIMLPDSDFSSLFEGNKDKSNNIISPIPSSSRTKQSFIPENSSSSMNDMEDFQKLSLVFANSIRMCCLTSDQLDIQYYNPNYKHFSETPRTRSYSKRHRTDTPNTTPSQLSCRSGLLSPSVSSETEVSTAELANLLYEKLKDLTFHKEPILFWDFVVDQRKDVGFDATCMNLFLITYLAKKNLVVFSINEDDLTYIEATDGVDETMIKNNYFSREEIITGWDHTVWLKFCDALQSRKKKAT